ncbi:hypothetical protein DRE_01228 [Drechslerella stenobrocha 248]|uniref:HD domain-containing protein n=1 Tax=Drechslerella stenobrocha 248 TaxID=1043628 RepID=W7HWD4_9PEZI|nr:hypothetical protein DRE_01228 [Drechslerella stenobrocha 248]
MLEAYSQPHRAYHDTTHITFMLGRLDDDVLEGEIEFDEWERRCVMLAIWWHDYVYDPRSKDNEVQSILAWEGFVDQVSHAQGAPVLV